MLTTAFSDRYMKRLMEEAGNSSYHVIANSASVNNSIFWC